MEKQYKQRVSQQHPVLSSPACLSQAQVSSVPACLPASRLTASAGETKSYKINKLGISKLK